MNLPTLQNQPLALAGVLGGIYTDGPLDNSMFWNRFHLHMLKVEDQTLKMVPSDGHIDPFTTFAGLLAWPPLKNMLSRG